MNNFIVAATSLMNYLYSQGIVQNISRLWVGVFWPFTTFEKGSLAWHSESWNNIGHWCQSHLCPSKSREIFSRTEGAQHYKDIQSKMYLIGILQLPAAQKLQKSWNISKSIKSVSPGNVHLKLQGKRFPYHCTVNLLWSVGVLRDSIYILMPQASWAVWGEKSYLAPVMSRKEKKAATVPRDCFVFNNFRLSNNAF